MSEQEHRRKHFRSVGGVRSNGNYVDEQFTVQGGWNNGSVGNGVISFVADGAENVLKLDGGTTYNASNLARAFDVLSGPAGNRITVSLKLRGNWGNYGIVPVQCRVQVFLASTYEFFVEFYGDSIVVWDTVAGNSIIYTTIPSANSGYFTFDIYRDTGKCNIYQDGSPLTSGVDCIRTASSTQWNTFLDTFSRETPVYTQRIGWIYRLMIGDNLVTI